MREGEYDALWQDREYRYPGAQLLPVDQPVHILVDPAYAATYAGQVAIITAASLFGRMTKSVAVQVPPLPVVPFLPWSGRTLDEVVIQTLNAAHPRGSYEQRSAVASDLCLFIGPSGDGLIIHGSGWGAYFGSQPSPLAQSGEANPFGAAFAVIAAAARLQLNMESAYFEPTVVDTYLWRLGIPSPGTPEMQANFEIGELWCIGVGSVGNCALFFLSLATRAFSPVLVDGDKVKEENVTRSALYSWEDALARTPKVEAACRWLRHAGVGHVEPHIAWLDEIPERWLERKAGTPNVLIAAANERNVRTMIEAGYPPLQVYATTGQNWQATLVRHIPMRDPCSLCVPGGKVTAAVPLCATEAPVAGGNNVEDDVALPFLSYGAGLMTAAEIAKLAVSDDFTTLNRFSFEARNPKVVVGSALQFKSGCMCQRRDALTYAEAIRGSRFAGLSAITGV